MLRVQGQRRLCSRRRAVVSLAISLAQRVLPATYQKRLAATSTAWRKPARTPDIAGADENNAMTIGKFSSIPPSCFLLAVEPDNRLTADALLRDPLRDMLVRADTILAQSKRQREWMLGR